MKAATKKVVKIGTSPDIHHKLFEKLMKNRKAQEAHEVEGAILNSFEKGNTQKLRKSANR